MMVAHIGQQPHTQTHLAPRRIFQQAPSQTGAVPAVFHPDARLDQQIVQTVMPDRHAAIQPERFYGKMSPRLYRATAPTVGVQRCDPITIQQLGIGLGKQQMPL